MHSRLHGFEAIVRAGEVHTRVDSLRLRLRDGVSGRGV
jgi:hypothetical protein